jgi:hypothetical protein
MKSKKYKLSSIVFYSIIIALALVLPNMAFATPVPDTGQTQSYTDTFGEDSDYTCNPHSYTDLGNGIVRDNVTELEWQQTTAPGTYTWEQALDYVAGMNSGSGTYGFTDWRLPTIKELSTLVDSSIPYPAGPTINTTFFPDTVTYGYWSSTTHAGRTGDAWKVNFSSGYVINSYKTYDDYVRAVRGGQTVNNFVDNSDGTISDTSTGLMWQKATAPGTYTWEQAITYCENLTLPAGGYSDWRMPNRNELQSIVDYSRYNPAIDTTYFPGTVASYYWSSTTYAYITIVAWGVYFDYGYVYNGFDKTYDYYVRAVRGDGSSGTSTILPTTTTTTPISTTTTTTTPSATTTIPEYTTSTSTTTSMFIDTTTVPTTTTSTTIPSGPCAAEAIYGENSEQTELLREYRDKALSKTPDGQEMIKTYYKFSPAVTKLLESSPLLKKKAKAFIDSMLPGIRKKVEESNKE